MNFFRFQFHSDLENLLRERLSIVEYAIYSNIIDI
ncbi:hypothetical protein HLRTI_002314 [Halorhabdus tiamatea SARL4B]|uniref:Uncharacterized protein n=1 Tax=Halorhabdus tiamatea SARL4B TaxID=1033806 RepID=U2DIB7_9EURY|nr:hypothetical protein HLRTI_002314 [Halorhabdus tiamatea SARL4B]